MTESQTIVLITGANSGVGLATSQVLSQSAHYHIIMSGRSASKIDAAVHLVQSSPSTLGTISPLTMDVTSEPSILAAVDEVTTQFGRVDVLINNAGIGSRNPHLKSNVQETLDANVIGPIVVTDAFKALVLKSRAGKVIFVTSGLGSLARAADPQDPFYRGGYDVYRVSKAALNMYMVQVEKELREMGVKVWGVCPGLVRSNLRGTAEEQVSAGGMAVDAEVSGVLIRDVIEGKRDADIGKVVKKGGLWEW